MMIYEIEQLLLSSKVIGDDCWQEKNSKGFKKRLRNFPFNVLVIRGRIILKREGMFTWSHNSHNFDVKSASIQFYSNSHNSQSDHWIGLKFYMDSSDILSYVGLTFQSNRSSGRHRNTGQQRLYEFCYLLLFDLWTYYCYDYFLLSLGVYLYYLGLIVSGHHISPHKGY